MRPFISIVIGLTFLFFASSAKNESSGEVSIEYPFKQYTVQDGLVQMQVQSLFQDSKGYLWCGTKTGVSRFDGRNFVNYNSLELQQNSPVVFIDEDKQGNILVFNQKNLSVIGPGLVKSFNYPKDYSLFEFETKPYHHTEFPICRIARNKNRRFENILLHYKNIDSMYVEEFNPVFGNKFFFNEKEQDFLWQIRQDSIFKVNLFSQQVTEAYNNPGLTLLTYFKNNWYGFSKQHGIYKLKGNNFVLKFKFNFNEPPLKIIQSPDKNSLVICTRKSLYQFENGVLKTIKTGLTLIRDILFDHEGNLWVATEEGLYNFFKLNFVNYTFGMGNKDWVWSIVQDSNENMWFSSFQNGIWSWDGTKIADYTQQLNEQKIRDFNIKHDYTYFMGASRYGNKVYFTTNANILVYNGKKFKVLNKVDNNWNQAYFFTKTLPDSTFYCGGMPGLFKVSVNGNTRKWSAESLGISTVVNVEVDKDKSLTAIGSTGIARITDDSLFYINKDELKKNYCSTVDHKGNIWVGGNQELKLIQSDSLQSVFSESSEHIFSLLFVKPHYLLMGGINGLYVANLHDYYQRGIFEAILYNRNSGFMGSECGQNGFFTDADGFVWINTSDLVTRFQPQKLITNKPVAPFLYLTTQMSTDNIQWHTIENITNSIFTHKQKNFRFLLQSVSFCNAQNLRYYYKLDGFQEEWSEAVEIDEITFYNLAPGNYRLLARADAGTSNTASKIVSFQFKIEYPFWLKWWFISLMLLLLVLIIIVIVFMLNRRTKQKELIKKRIVQLRADALHSQMNPHLIYNALNNINGLINLGEKIRAQDYLNTFSDLLRLVFKSTNKQEITLKNELEIIESFIQFHKETSNKFFNYELVIDLTVDSAKILVPPVIIQPFVENAILHGFSGNSIKDGLIRVKVTNNDKRLIISVEDNGVGYGNSHAKGNGIGMRLTRERIQLLERKNDNQIQIRKLKPGTLVEINIPLKRIP